MAGDKEAEGRSAGEPEIRDRVLVARRLCFFAHYHHLGLAAGHVLHYLDALRTAGFEVVVLSAATMDDEQAATLRAHCAELVFRPNEGLDFGGWIEALARYPALTADLLLLANDSVYGPVGDLAAFVDRLTATPADFYGAVEYAGRRDDPFGAHLQSWFLLLRPAAYNSAAFRELMRGPIDAARSREDVIAAYELGVTQRLVAAGLTYHAAYRQSARGPLARRFGYNPTHMIWRELVERFGVPFVKVELLRYNSTGIRDVGRALGVIAARAPALAPLVARDLASRAVSSRRPATLRDRIAGWRDGRYRSYWPEIQAPLRRDAVLAPGSVGSRLNAALFHLAVLAGDAAALAVNGGLRLHDTLTGRRGLRGPRPGSPGA